MSADPAPGAPGAVVRTEEEQRLVVAALEALQGSDQVDFSITEVLARARSNRAALYASFGSKDRLVLAAVGEAVSRTVAAVDAHIRELPTQADALATWVRLLLGRAGDPTVAGWTRPFALDEHRLLHRFPEAEDVILLPLQRQVRALLPADLEAPDQVATAIYTMVIGLQAMAIARGVPPSEADIASYVGCALRLAGLDSAPSRGRTKTLLRRSTRG